MDPTLADRTRAELLATVEAYLAATRMNEGAFGLRAVNDGKLLRRLRSGANITLASIARIEAFIAANPPPEPAQPTASAEAA